MTASEVLDRLTRDNPLFHFTDANGVQVARKLGYEFPEGDFSMAVIPEVLQWMAKHLTGETISLETGAGHTTVLCAALAKHHYCFTPSTLEIEKIKKYLESIGIPLSKVTFVPGFSDATLPRFEPPEKIDFAYLDGCHGYPFPALDWHCVDKHLKVGGLLGMDNVEIRPVREHCDFLQENGCYELVEKIMDINFAYFYRKLSDQEREWVFQRYSLAKKDPCDWRYPTRVKRKISQWVKPYLY